MDSTPPTDRIDVAYVADLARLRLTAEETAAFQAQLEDILGYVRLLNEADTAGVEPEAHPVPMVNVLREDVSGECLAVETVLANAPAEREGQFLVPQIVE